MLSSWYRISWLVLTHFILYCWELFVWYDYSWSVYQLGWVNNKWQYVHQTKVILRYWAEKGIHQLDCVEKHASWTQSKCRSNLGHILFIFYFYHNIIMQKFSFPMVHTCETLNHCFQTNFNLNMDQTGKCLCCLQHPVYTKIRCT